MLHPQSGCRGRVSFQTFFMLVCIVMLLLWLIFCTLTSRDVIPKTIQYPESWNMSLFLKRTVNTLESATKHPKISRKRKLVLLWTDMFSRKNWLPSPSNLHCPVTECDTSRDRSLLMNSSAVILHLRSININDLPVCFPSKDTHCPIMVLLNKEAPPHTSRKILRAVEGMVHWTATYRKDSDLLAPYGKIERRMIRNSTKSNFNLNKRLLCWLVSNCKTPSKREEFVNELKNYIDVNIYGRCGKLKCPYVLTKDCYKWLSNRCHFYLSFENSNCKDYITEKFYYALMSDMVPVVLGNSDNYKHFPPRSFINALDFPSPKELAKYLVSLKKDRDAFLSYFKWKKDFEAKDHAYLWLCDLCKKLHETKIEEVKPRSNLESWWFDQLECTSSRNLYKPAVSGRANRTKKWGSSNLS